MATTGNQESFFRRIQSFKSDYSPTSFTQYESKRTGMRVVVIDQQSPLVNGYFALATEIHDDSGAPHTLEHLCFMGSRSYQYKGFLDKLATRFYSDTNAWTDTDHTAYTLETSGWTSFATMLPVYLEHVIAPTLTDEGCYTEVYHVDGSGHDAGVVYSEMQGVQNDSSSLMDLRAKKTMYPENVGYRYETGGMTDALRVLTPERIRQFHREMYQPKNLCLVITGQVDHDDMLRVLDGFESTVLDIIPNPEAPFKRPFVESQPPPLKGTIVERVEFPEEDEEFGEIEIRFLGPDTNDPVQATAVQISLAYLAGSSASLLMNTLVDKEQLCTCVWTLTEDRPHTEIQFKLSSVKTAKLADVEKRFFEVLRDAMAKELDLKYMRECLQRHKRGWKYSAESTAETFSQSAITDFIYGKRDGSTLAPLGSLQEYDVLAEWTEEQWKEFIKQWISDAPHVSILGVPSSKMAASLKAAEKERVKKRKQELGEEGLEKLRAKLKEAMEFNDRPIPREDLMKFKVPGIETIPFIHTTTARSGAALKEAGHQDNRIQKLLDEDGAGNLPLFIHFEHIPSNFAHVTLYLSTEGVATELKPLVSVYTEAFFNLPIKRDGQVIEFEKVIVELERETVSYSMEKPFNYVPELLSISFSVEVEKYATVINWLKTLTWDSIFDVERLRSINSRLLSDVPEAKRSGSSMLSAVTRMVQHTPESIIRARSALVKALYLKRIKKLLQKDPESVVERMKQIREQLFRFENMRVLVIADLEKLEKPVSSWAPYIESLDTKKPLRPIIKLRERLTDAMKTPGKSNYVVSLPPIESSYMTVTAKGIDSWENPKLPALMVAIAYMNAVEGPLWVAVRGTGLAYGANFHHRVASGLVGLDVWRSPNAHKAFEAARKTVADLASGAVEIDPSLSLEGAVSSIVTEFVYDQNTQVTAAQASFVTQVVSGLPADHMTRTLKKVKECGVEDIKMALREFILPLFEAGKADLIVTCAPLLEESIKTGFESRGFKPEVKALKDFEDDYGLKLDEEDSEGSEDEEEEECSECESGSGSEKDEKSTDEDEE